MPLARISLASSRASSGDMFSTIWLRPRSPSMPSTSAPFQNQAGTGLGGRVHIATWRHFATLVPIVGENHSEDFNATAYVVLVSERLGYTYIDVRTHDRLSFLRRTTRLSRPFRLCPFGDIPKHPPRSVIRSERPFSRAFFGTAAGYTPGQCHTEVRCSRGTRDDAVKIMLVLIRELAPLVYTTALTIGSDRHFRTRVIGKEAMHFRAMTP